MSGRKVIMEGAEISRAIVRIAHEISEKNGGLNDVALVGIQTRGEPLAMRLADALSRTEGERPLVGTLDITLYRDDLTLMYDAPVVKGSRIDFDIDEKIIVLCDDVLYTGRTVRAAIDCLMEKGRPKAVQLAELIDRGHRELPIRADYVGKNVPTSGRERIEVEFSETDGRDRVSICERD